MTLLFVVGAVCVASLNVNIEAKENHPRLDDLLK
jgi:hypothetical protein